MGRKFGMDIHESKESVIYVRTDFGGTICRWDPGS